MDEETHLEDRKVKFNAGVDISISISQIIKNCEYYARIKDFPNWHGELKILHRRISKKFEENSTAKTEVENASKDTLGVMKIYQKKIIRGKKIPVSVLYQVYNYLSGYEIVLRKYVDSFGYGMPEGEDLTEAAWR
ncbi:MAG: hypothetical protein HYT62_02895 [Candidatus Yanofskybacteria bacterium]|nr:hypothetical protein [Candidatus Yanofskybacteria bacterium]